MLTPAFTCVLIAGLMPVLFTGIAKFSGPGFNNRRPREFQARLEGWRARAHYAHLNSFEAFPPFAAAVIINHLMHGANSTANTLAIVFVVARLLFGLLYMMDKPSLRSAAWMVATGCWVALFFV
jgi:uncharacterized MAPEG superfamily protein